MSCDQLHQGRGTVCLFFNNWRASVASETLTGVTQSKIGDVSLFIGERAKRARHYQG